MKRFLLAVLIVMMAVSFVQAPAFAVEAEYHKTVSNNLNSGLQNLLLGWTEIIMQPINDPAVLPGFLKGPLYAVIVTIGGALKIATFAIPIDIPLPDGGVNFS